MNVRESDNDFRSDVNMSTGENKRQCDNTAIFKYDVNSGYVSCCVDVDLRVRHKFYFHFAILRLPKHFDSKSHIIIYKYNSTFS